MLYKNFVTTSLYKNKGNSDMKIKKEHNLTNKIFNDWKVLQLSEYRSDSDRDRYWDCQCKCGTEKPVKACYLKSGQSKRCVECAHERQRIRGRKIPLGYWNNMKRNALKRGLEFSITKEDVISVLNRQSNKCALSGLPIQFAETASDHLQGKTTASVDRIDSKHGYKISNIQIVHKTINFMKRDLEQDDFITLCEHVTSNQ